MAFYTPRGLKIQLPIDYSFTLIARLYPNVDAFTVLKTTEGIESIPSLITLVTGLICFYFQLPPVEIGIYVFILSIVGFTITSFGSNKIPGILVRIGTLYSYISGFGILYIVLTVYGYFMVGWEGLIAFFAAKLIAGIIKIPIERIQMNRIYSKTESILTTSEINFLSAYLFHAERLGRSLDITVSEKELKEEKWKHVLNDLATKWPEVVKRFTKD